MQHVCICILSIAVMYNGTTSMQCIIQEFACEIAYLHRVRFFGLTEFIQVNYPFLNNIMWLCENCQLTDNEASLSSWYFAATPKRVLLLPEVQAKVTAVSS